MVDCNVHHKMIQNWILFFTLFLINIQLLAALSCYQNPYDSANSQDSLENEDCFESTVCYRYFIDSILNSLFRTINNRNLFTLEKYPIRRMDMGVENVGVSFSQTLNAI